MKNKLYCENCLTEIEHSLFSITTIVKCENCQKEYIVVKNRVLMIIETFFLFLAAIFSKSILTSLEIDLHILVELGIVFLILVVLNYLYDYLFIRVIKKHNYFILVERLGKAPAIKNKKKDV